MDLMRDDQISSLSVSHLSHEPYGCPVGLLASGNTEEEVMVRVDLESSRGGLFGWGLGMELSSGGRGVGGYKEGRGPHQLEEESQGGRTSP